MFITFEGIDLSGKSTQCKLLKEYLMGKGYDVILLREPGGTDISERIREVLLDRKSDGIVPLAEFFLYSAARAQLVEQIIRPALAEGKVVICDRYDDSSTAYQGFARGLGVEKIENINEIATGNLIPDLTFFIDISVEESLKRLKVAGKLQDRMEAEGRKFFNLVRDGYLQLATKHNDSEKGRFKTLNGTDDIGTIQRRIRDIVNRRLGLT